MQQFLLNDEREVDGAREARRWWLDGDGVGSGGRCWPPDWVGPGLPVPGMTRPAPQPERGEGSRARSRSGWRGGDLRSGECEQGEEVGRARGSVGMRAV